MTAPTSPRHPETNRSSRSVHRGGTGPGIPAFRPPCHILVILLGSLSLVACSPSRTPLVGTLESPHAVAEAVLAAVAARDVQALQALALSEREFRQHVWPELPAARPERNLPFSYVWGDLRQKSDTRLNATLAAHGGRRYALEQVRFSGETRYPTYTVHRESVFVVQGPDGPLELRLSGSMIEANGRWKVFSYLVDD